MEVFFYDEAILQNPVLIRVKCFVMQVSLLCFPVNSLYYENLQSIVVITVNEMVVVVIVVAIFQLLAYIACCL